MVSITLEENIKSAQRLTKKITDSNKRVPVFVGGQAVNFGEHNFTGNLIKADTTLEQIPKLLTKRKK